MGKKIITALLAITILTSCANNNDSARVYENRIEAKDISIITIDSCEYVWMKRGYGAGLCHKGDCKFCANRK